VAIIGGGAAGLMTAIWAARAAREGAPDTRAPKPRIVVLDGARTLGAKILVAGGGRCNVTHVAVTERDFNGSTPAAIKRVLHRFPVDATVAFFEALGVPLKREDTGKLFPVSDCARDVLNALTEECQRLGVELRHPWRVSSVAASMPASSFVLRSDRGEVLSATGIVLATGGKSLPKSGSDGAGHEFARQFGHRIEQLVPALVPLVLDQRATPLTGLSGISACVGLEVRSGTGKRLWSTEGEILCTHVGVSGPAVLDASRHYSVVRRQDPRACLVVNWLPGLSREAADRALQQLGTSTPGVWLRRALPERLARAVCDVAGVSASRPGAELMREGRIRLVQAVTEMHLPVTGDRGFTHAEVTAGGVPLSELRLDSLESRFQPGLHLVGEICDVDGRIGGFNFQWAWASGFVAGQAVGRLSLARSLAMEAQ
jgi:predicted Rossmann fold flavoprotein